MALVRRFILLERSICGAGSALRAGCRNYSFLPASYHLDDTWAKRLDSSFVKQIRLEQFFNELRKKFEADGMGSPLDVDIFATAVQRPEDLDSLHELLVFLRNSKNTPLTRSSTFNAVIRTHLDLERYDDLMKILADKIKYGIFLDHYTANLLMDKFIELKRLPDAVRVAIDLMFQEDFDHPLTRELALFSCLSLMKTEGWESSIPPLNIKPEPEDTGEEVIIYKQFLKNPFFDDHFDLTDAKHRLGKTLYVAGHAKDDLLGRSAQVLGLGMYEKWSKGVAVLEKLAASASGDNSKIMKETVDGFLTALQKKSEASGEEAATTEIKSLMSRAQTAQKLLQDAGALKDGTAVALSEQQVRDAVTATADSVTAQQRAAYEEAVTYRDKEISRQVRRFQLEERLRVLKLQREQLKNEEDLLFFFERKTTWENMLTPEARQAMAAQQAEDGSFYDYRVEDPQYEIPQILTPQTYTPFARWQRRQEDHEAKLRGYKLERFLGEYGRKKRDEKRARKGLKPIGVAAARSLPGDPPNWRELLMKR